MRFAVGFMVAVVLMFALYLNSSAKTTYDNKNVELMSDGTLITEEMTKNSVWQGRRIRGFERTLFYVAHPFSVRPTGYGDLYIMKLVEKLDNPGFTCTLNHGCVKHTLPIT